VRRVCIAAASEIAAHAGAEIGDAGGNAVDAGVAATLAAMSTDPGIIAPGAGAFVVVWPASEVPVVMDGYAEMPGRGLDSGSVQEFGERVSMAYGGGMETLVGHASVATPGAFAGLSAAAESYGHLAWAQLLEPTIRWAESGFPLSDVAAAYMVYSREPIFSRLPESRRALHRDDGTPLHEGDTVFIEGLADSLRLIAEEGPECFYTGSIGRLLAEDMAANGGRLTADDLEAYTALERRPVMIPFGGWEVAVNPPPAIGGAALGAMLALLDGDTADVLTETGARRLAAVQRAVLEYRLEHIDGSEQSAAAATALLDKAGRGELLASPSTVHTSAVDSDGLACAITASAGYGSGVMIPGTGLWLNNSLGELELLPDDGHSLGVGERLPSNMAPTIARRDDGAVLAVGSPGASRITTSLAQVLLNFVKLGMSLTEAVAHARLHVEVFEGRPTIACEPGVPITECGDLVVRRFPDISMYFGAVGAAMWDPIGGLFGAADPRRSGMVAVGGL
jgi:gamma-glutamyltranspeptidase/glutathione hydrolase